MSWQRLWDVSCSCGRSSTVGYREPWRCRKDKGGASAALKHGAVRVRPAGAPHRVLGPPPTPAQQALLAAMLVLAES